MKLSSLIPVALSLLVGVTGTSVYAGDCKQNRFEFVNKYKVAGTGVEIKVKKVHIVGNDGTWNEDISNKKVDPNRSYKTNKRRLNKLDSGKTGTFTVHFDHRKIGPGWQSATHGPFSMKCHDGKTFKFTIM